MHSATLQLMTGRREPPATPVNTFSDPKTHPPPDHLLPRLQPPRGWGGSRLRSAPLPSSGCTTPTPKFFSYKKSLSNNILV